MTHWQRPGARALELRRWQHQAATAPLPDNSNGGPVQAGVEGGPPGPTVARTSHIMIATYENPGGPARARGALRRTGLNNLKAARAASLGLEGRGSGIVQVLHHFQVLRRRAVRCASFSSCTNS